MQPEQATLPTPSTKVRALDRLVGRWSITGGTSGTVDCAWLPGEFFLQQTVELEQYGQHVRGVEIIGQLHPS